MAQIIDHRMYIHVRECMKFAFESAHKRGNLCGRDLAPPLRHVIGIEYLVHEETYKQLTDSL